MNLFNPWAGPKIVHWSQRTSLGATDWQRTYTATGGGKRKNLKGRPLICYCEVSTNPPLIHVLGRDTKWDKRGDRAKPEKNAPDGKIQTSSDAARREIHNYENDRLLLAGSEKTRKGKKI